MINNIINKAENSNWYSKKEICSICKVGHSAFERFILILTNEDQKYIQKRPSRNGGHLYTEPILQKFQLWLKKNAMNAGGQRTEGSVIKQDNQQDLFIGCVATKGTPDEIRSLAQHLQNFANQKELLEKTQYQVKQLECENKQKDYTIVQLTEENGFLKKLNNFNLPN